MVEQHTKQLIDRGAALSEPCRDCTSTVQAAADLPDKAVERILFEASPQQDKITFITTMRVELDSEKASLTRIDNTFLSIQEHVHQYNPFGHNIIIMRISHKNLDSDDGICTGPPAVVYSLRAFDDNYCK